MKLYGVTCVFNEEKLVPFVMDYMVRWGYDRFVIYDNGSNDKTVELLKAYPFIEVRNFDTENVFDECKRKDKIKTPSLNCRNGIAKTVMK